MSRSAARRPVGGRRRREDEGYAMVMSALLLVPLLAFTGLGVDVGSWYVTANRMQRAADAGALAGVVWMPDEGRAEEAALAAVRQNGYDAADPDIDVTVVPVGSQRLRVTIYDAEVDMYFSSIFLDGVDVERAATAEYVRSVPMGSPSYELANDPERWSEPGYERPFFWLNIAGTQTNKSNGDRHTAGNCTGFSGCAGSTNLDFSESGYFFRLTVDDVNSAQDLRVQAYDPAFFYENDTCTNGRLLDPADPGYPTQIATLQAQGHPDAATRFVEGNTEWCTGDQALNGADIETTYVIRAPDDTPFDNGDNPVVCGITFDAYDEALYPLLDQADGYKDGPIGSENMAFDEHYRQWTDLCTIPAGSAQLGDYLIQVTTTSDQSTPALLGTHDPLVSTGGHNRFAMRAGFGDPTLSAFSEGINFFADGRLPIYVNQSTGGAATNFYLARVTPEYAGQILQLQFYDVADGANSDLTILPPADRTGDPLGACTFIRDDAPPQVITPGNCTITGLNSANYNGRLVSVQIPIPANYSCAAGNEFGCWFKVDLDFNGGSPRDTTTWSAKVVGDPVRLVE